MLYSITYVLYLISILVAFLASLTSYSRHNKIGYLKYFPPFLFLTILVEISGYFIAVKYGNNQFLFNFFTLVGLIFYFFILHEGVRSKIVKKVIRVIMILYGPFTLCWIFFVNGVYEFHSISFGIGVFLLILMCIYYFLFQFFKTPVEENIKRDPLVFICLGLIVFHAITFTYFSGIHIFQNFSQSFIDGMILVCMISNYALYAFFTTAFLLNHKYSKIEIVEYPKLPDL